MEGTMHTMTRKEVMETVTEREYAVFDPKTKMVTVFDRPSMIFGEEKIKRIYVFADEKGEALKQLEFKAMQKTL